MYSTQPKPFAEYLVFREHDCVTREQIVRDRFTLCRKTENAVRRETRKRGYNGDLYQESNRVGTFGQELVIADIIHSLGRRVDVDLAARFVRNVILQGQAE